MKVHLRLFALCIVLATVFAACGGSGGSSSSGQSSKTLSLWMVQSGAAGNLIRSNIKKFEAAHPGVTVNVQQYSEDIKVKVQTSMVAHSLPDVLTWWGGSFMDPEIQSGALLDMAPYINSHADWKSTFLADAFSNYTRGDKVYGVPNESPVVELWYNTALFQKAGIQGPPKTFDDLLSDAKLLNQHHIIPISVGGKDGWPLQEWYTYLVMRDGGNNTIFQAMKGQVSWTAEPFNQASQQIKQLVQANAFQPGFTGTDATTAGNMYYNQQAAMTLIGSWILGDLSLPDNKQIAQNTRFAEFPVVNGGQGSTDDAQGGPNNCWSVSSRTKNPALAEDLIRFLTSSPQTDQYSSQVLQIVPNKVTTSTSSLPLYNSVVQKVGTYQHYNLFWNEILPAAPATQYINLLQQMAAGQISPTDMNKQFQTYMQQQSNS